MWGRDCAQASWRCQFHPKLWERLVFLALSAFFPSLSLDQSEVGQAQNAPLSPNTLELWCPICISQRSENGSSMSGVCLPAPGSRVTFCSYPAVRLQVQYHSYHLLCAAVIPDFHFSIPSPDFCQWESRCARNVGPSPSWDLSKTSATSFFSLLLFFLSISQAETWLSSPQQCNQHIEDLHIIIPLHPFPEFLKLIYSSKCMSKAFPPLPWMASDTLKLK